jgi:1-acyl-sn-glycerol-3-phosphate acyltransferase
VTDDPGERARRARVGPRELAVTVTPRYRLMRWLDRLVVRSLFDVRVEGLERWPAPPFQLVCTHHSGWDPMILIAVVPAQPRITWFGPREADFSRGFKNRVMAFFGGVIPFNPEKTTLVSAVRAVRRVFDAGGVLGIFAEGRVGFRESALLQFEEGAVAFASAAAVPIVPCAITGSAELWFRKRVTVRMGDPIPSAEHRGAVGRAALEGLVVQALEALLPATEPRLPRRRPLAWIGEILDGSDDRERHARYREEREERATRTPHDPQVR